MAVFALTATARSQDFLSFTTTRIQDDIEALNSVAVGPDGNVYAAGTSGAIYRWVIDPVDGRANAPAETVFVTPDATIMTGIAFDPASTAENLILWTSYNTLGFNVRGFGGRVDRVEIPSLGSPAAPTSQSYITGLPVDFHQNNGLAFGPDGRLYLSLASLDESGGDPTSPETPLSASVVVADVNAGGFLVSGQQLDVNTDAGYDPTLPGAKLQVFGEGIRNAYDLVWHSNGGLYAGVNGNDSGGFVPDDPGTAFDESVVPAGSPDETFIRIEDGKFYGHPNPSQGSFISYGGNPTPGAGNDGDWENPNYPAGTLPDPNWDESLQYNILDEAGTGSTSPNGVAEYTGASALDGRILLTYFFGGQNQIAAIELNPDGSVSTVDTLTNLEGGNLDVDAPLDVAVDPASGRIYVASYDSPSGSPTSASTFGGLYLLTPFDPSAPPLGSFDGDGDLDADDYAILIENLHTDASALTFSAAYALGDLTGDKLIDYDDLQDFRTLLAEASMSAAPIGTPEPGAAGLLVGAGCLLSGRRRRTQARW